MASSFQRPWFASFLQLIEQNESVSPGDGRKCLSPQTFKELLSETDSDWTLEQFVLFTLRFVPENVKSGRDVCVRELRAFQL